MRTLAERLQEALARKPGGSQAALARFCRVQGPSVSNWFTGETKTLKAGSLRLAAEYLGVSRDWLETGKGAPGWQETHPAGEGPAPEGVAHHMSHTGNETAPTESIKVPVIGTLELGTSHMYELRASPDGRPIGHVPAPGVSSKAYAVRVFGDDLYPAVRHGACLVVDPSARLQEGELMLLENTEGQYFVCELVSLRDDAVTVSPAKGGQRRTLARATVAAMHPVLYVASGALFENGST